MWQNYYGYGQQQNVWPITILFDVFLVSIVGIAEKITIKTEVLENKTSC